jgi:hypothetical protein
MKYELVNGEQAASILGVTSSQLQKMLRRGILKPAPESPSTVANRLYRMTDIAALKEIREKGSNPEAAFVEAKRASMEARALRRELDQIRFVLGLNTPHIATDRDSVVSLLLRAEDALREPASRNPTVLLEWAKTLYGLTESHFEAITFYTDQKEPWRAFLRLGRKLCDGQDVLVTRYNPELETTYQLLNTGLRTARRTAYFHVRTLYGKELAAEMFPEVKGCPHEDVIALSMNNLVWEAPRNE